MQKDNLYVKDEAQAKLMNGIRKSAEAVGGTMGTGGSNAIIEAIENPGHLMTNDGWTILNSIVFADPIEDMGRKILCEAVSRANKASGDGSSTTCVLTASIIENGVKFKGDTHAMVVKRSLEDCVSLIEESIKKQTRQLFDDSGALNLTLLEQVATISSEDSEIGKRIAEIYSQIGKTGIIHWDISRTAEDSYTVGSGVTIEGANWYSPYMCDATESGHSSNQVRIKNPYILVTKQKLSSAADLNEIAAELNGKEVKDLVVFCDDVDPLVVPDIIKTRMMRGFRIVVVKMPVLWKDQWFQDLGLITGAIVADSAAGRPLKSLTVKDLGRAGNIVITKEDTYIDGILDASAMIKTLEEENTDDSKLRASRLNTKTARYFVGAHSDSALSYRRLKVEDAISAAWQALNGGIVPGGGIALARVALSFGANQDTMGKKILAQALLAPLHQILANAGVTDKNFETGISYPDGYDTRTGEIVNMFDAGIIDPANIVLNAAKNAISVAASILTAKAVVTFPREEQRQDTPSVVSR